MCQDKPQCTQFNIMASNINDIDSDLLTINEFIHVSQVIDSKSLLILNSLLEGNLIDTERYRGTGVWYYDGHQLYKAEGEYGYILPFSAYKMIHNHGLEYFGNYMTSCEIVSIPQNLEIIVDGQTINNTGHCGLSIRNEEDETNMITIGNITIGYQTYQTYFYDITP